MAESKTSHWTRLLTDRRCNWVRALRDWPTERPNFINQAEFVHFATVPDGPIYKAWEALQAAVVQITVESSKGLPKADLIGSNDTYVELLWGETVIGKTSIIKGSMTPVWGGEAGGKGEGKETFVFTVTPLAPLVRPEHRAMLTIRVKDWDRVGADDLLGTAVIGEEVSECVNARMSQTDGKEDCREEDFRFQRTRARVGRV